MVCVCLSVCACVCVCASVCASVYVWHVSMCVWCVRVHVCVVWCGVMWCDVVYGVVCKHVCVCAC